MIYTRGGALIEGLFCDSIVLRTTESPLVCLVRASLILLPSIPTEKTQKSQGSDAGVAGGD